jgi:hypothetical protein
MYLGKQTPYTWKGKMIKVVQSNYSKKKIRFKLLFSNLKVSFERNEFINYLFWSLESFLWNGNGSKTFKLKQVFYSGTYKWEEVD